MLELLPALPPAATPTPVATAEALRRIHPRVAMLHAVDDLWWMIWANPEGAAERARTGHGILQRERLGALEGQAPDWPLRKQAECMIAGWQLLGDYRSGPCPPTGFLCAELQFKLTRTPAELEELEKAAAYEATDAHGDRMRAQRAEYLRLEGRSIWKYAKRQLK